MNDLTAQYEMLNDFGKQELRDYLHYLLTKYGTWRTAPVVVVSPAPVAPATVTYEPKTIGALLHAMENITDPEFADRIEEAQENWKNWTIETW